MRLSALALACGAACTSVHGGAVELSWRLRASSGSTQSFLDCDSTPAPVTAIRISWQIEDPAEDTGHSDFTCSHGQGVTGFELPPGEALLSVVPLCGAADAEANPLSYIAPAPEERTVIAGNTITLGAIELILVVDNCLEQPCICE